MTTENVTPSYQNREHTYARRGLTPLPEPHITGMKLLEDVSLGSLVLNRLDSDGVVWVVRDIEGWWTVPDSDYPDNDKAYGDGEYDVTGRFLGRQLSLTGSILCPDPSLTSQARDKLVNAINLVYSDTWLKATERQQGTSVLATISTVERTSDYATYTTVANHGLSVGEIITISGAESGFNGTVVVVEKTNTTFSCIRAGDDSPSTPSSGSVYLGEIIKAARVRLVDSPTIEVVTARGRIDFEVSLRAVDPIKYYWATGTDNYQNAELLVSPNNDGSNGDGVRMVCNAGNYSVGGIITVTGPVESPMIIRNRTTGQVMQVTSPLAGNETFSVFREEIFDGIATLTLGRAHGLSVGKTITISGFTSTYNGTHVITDIPDSDLGLKAQKISFEVEFGTTKRVSKYTVGKQVSLSSAAVSSNVATITTATNHGFEVGQEVYISISSGSSIYAGFRDITATTDDTFSFALTNANTSGAVTGFARVPGIITLRTNETHPFNAGDTVVVRGSSPIINTPGTEILTDTSTNFTYYASTTRQVALASYYATPTESDDDTYTITTVGPHGYRVGDNIIVQGCGPFFNVSLAEITDVDNVKYTVSYTKASKVKYISSVSYTKVQSGENKGKYKVTITTSAAHGYIDGQVVRLRVVTTKGRNRPKAYDGDKSIKIASSTSFTFFVQPAKETAAYLKEFFGAFTDSATTISVSIVNSGAGRSWVNLKDFVKAIPGGTITAIPPVYSYPDKTVRLATTANLTLSGSRTIDGITTADGDRILVKNQTNGANNGIYVAGSGSWTRATDFDAAASGEVETGASILVTEGNTLANTGWALTNTGTITVGTTDLTFAQVTPRGTASVSTLEDQKVEITPRPIVSVTADVLEIDTAKRSVLLNGAVEYARAKVNAATDWIKIQPGANEIYVIDRGDEDTPRSTVELDFRSGWIA